MKRGLINRASPLMLELVMWEAALENDPTELEVMYESAKYRALTTRNDNHIRVALLLRGARILVSKPLALKEA